MTEKKCRTIRDNGERCKKAPVPGSDLCFNHHPDYAEERRRIASKGGKASTTILAERRGPGAQEIRELKEELRALARDVKDEKVTPGVGTALNQIYNTLLRAMEQERRARESQDIEERLAALEEKAATVRGEGSRQWGA